MENVTIDTPEMEKTPNKGGNSEVRQVLIEEAIEALQDAKNMNQLIRATGRLIATFPNMTFSSAPDIEQVLDSDKNVEVGNMRVASEKGNPYNKKSPTDLVMVWQIDHPRISDRHFQIQNFHPRPKKRRGRIVGPDSSASCMKAEMDHSFAEAKAHWCDFLSDELEIEIEIDAPVRDKTQVMVQYPPLPEEDLLGNTSMAGPKQLKSPDPETKGLRKWLFMIGIKLQRRFGC